jgi:hypothetical protein
LITYIWPAPFAASDVRAEISRLPSCSTPALLFPAWAVYVRRSPGFLISPLGIGDFFACNLHICVALSHPSISAPLCAAFPAPVHPLGGARIEFRVIVCGPLSPLSDICAALSKLLVLRAVVWNLSGP